MICQTFHGRFSPKLIIIFSLKIFVFGKFVLEKNEIKLFFCNPISANFKRSSAKSINQPAVVLFYPKVDNKIFRIYVLLNALKNISPTKIMHKRRFIPAITNGLNNYCDIPCILIKCTNFVG